MGIELHNAHRHGIDLAKYAGGQLTIAHNGTITNGRGSDSIYGATSPWTIHNFGTIGSTGFGLPYGGSVYNHGNISRLGMTSGTVVNHGSIHYLLMVQGNLFNGRDGTIWSNGGYFHDYSTVWIQNRGSIDNLGTIIGGIDLGQGVIVNGSKNDTTASMLKEGNVLPLVGVDTGTIINYGTIYRAGVAHGTIINHGSIIIPIEVSGDLTVTGAKPRARRCSIA